MSATRKAYVRYRRAVRNLEAAALAELEQEAVVRIEQAEAYRRKDLVRKWSAEVDRRMEAVVEAVGRES